MKAQLLVAFLILSLFTAACGAAAEAPQAGPASTANAAAQTLSGSLVFLQLDPGRQNLMQFDLATGEARTLFAVPANGWLSQMDVSPDGSQIVLAYAPPPAGDDAQFGYSTLYLTLADGATEPRPLIDRASPEEIYFNPVWAPDSRTIYYSHVVPEGGDSFDYSVTLEQLDIVSGEVEVITENAIWPRVSPDGSRIVYVTSDPQTLENDLVVADAGGANTRHFVLPESFTAIDAPLFSPDGEWLYFSAVTEEPVAGLSWVDRLLGVQTAAAHDVPSDWWRIRLTGGTPERLTTLNKIGLYGDFSPNGQAMAFASITGLYTMNPDGTELTELLATTAGDMLSWVP
jgi:Tol biopolymer transport system component